MGYSPEENRVYLRQRYKSQRESFITYLGGQCVECETTQNLQIDHIDPTTKSFPIGKLWAEKDLLIAFKELQKCQLLCLDCHISKTSKEQSVERGWTHGTLYALQRKKCNCELCSLFRSNYNTYRRKDKSYVKGPYGRPSTHGDRLHYTRGCRCPLCREANAESERIRRASH